MTPPKRFLDLYAKGVEFCEQNGISLSWIRVWGLCDESDRNGQCFMFEGEWTIEEKRRHMPTSIKIPFGSLLPRVFVFAGSEAAAEDVFAPWRQWTDDRALVIAVAKSYGHEWKLAEPPPSLMSARGGMMRCSLCHTIQFENPWTSYPCGHEIQYLLDSKTKELPCPE